MTLGQIRHPTIKKNDYYPLIARAVERLDRSTGEARRAVYERARKAVAELRSNQPALLDAEITEAILALEEAIRKVEAEAARKSPTETRAEPRSAAPSEGMPDSDKIQSRDHGQPASSDRYDRPPALPNRQAPIFLPTASDDHVAPDGRGGTNTSSPPALAPHSATRAGVRKNAAAASPVGNHDAQKDAAPSPSSRSRMRAGRGTAVEVSSGGAYAVQLTSERSAAEAHASFRALRAKFPNQLGGREPIVRRTDLGAKGIYYRTMVGSFASMEKAAGMCRTLKAAGGNCRVQRN